MEVKDKIVVIDLGSSNVVVAVGTQTDEGKIHIDEITMNPVNGVINGEIRNIEDVPKAISEAVKSIEAQMGIKIGEAIVGVSGQSVKCASNSYYVFIGNDGEIKESDVMRLNDSMRDVQAPEGSKILKIIPQNYIINDREEVANPVGMFGNKLEANFNFVVCDNSVISRLEKALGKADIKVSRLEVNALASAQAVTLADERELGVAVVDIGAGTTDVTIYHNNNICYVGVIPIGSDCINKDIRSYGILERYVEELKTDHGSAMPEMESATQHIHVKGRTSRDPKEISCKTLASIIEARLIDIIDYVKGEIRESGYENKLSSGIVLTGGCAELRGIDSLFRRETGYDIRVGYADLYVDDSSVELTTDGRLSTAIGLMLSAVESGAAVKVEQIEPMGNISTPKEEVKATVEPPKEEKNEEKKEDDVNPEPKQGLLGKLSRKLTDWFEVVDENV